MEEYFYQVSTQLFVEVVEVEVQGRVNNHTCFCTNGSAHVHQVAGRRPSDKQVYCTTHQWCPRNKEHDHHIKRHNVEPTHLFLPTHRQLIVQVLLFNSPQVTLYPTTRDHVGYYHNNNSREVDKENATVQMEFLHKCEKFVFDRATRYQNDLALVAAPP